MGSDSFLRENRGVPSHNFHEENNLIARFSRRKLGEDAKKKVQALHSIKGGFPVVHTAIYALIYTLAALVFHHWPILLLHGILH